MLALRHTTLADSYYTSEHAVLKVAAQRVDPLDREDTTQYNSSCPISACSKLSGEYSLRP